MSDQNGSCFISFIKVVFIVYNITITAIVHQIMMIQTIGPSTFCPKSRYLIRLVVLYCTETGFSTFRYTPHITVTAFDWSDVEEHFALSLLKGVRNLCQNPMQSHILKKTVDLRVYEI